MESDKFNFGIQIDKFRIRQVAWFASQIVLDVMNKGQEDGKSGWETHHYMRHFEHAVRHLQDYHQVDTADKKLEHMAHALTRIAMALYVKEENTPAHCPKMEQSDIVDELIDNIKKSVRNSLEDPDFVVVNAKESSTVASINKDSVRKTRSKALEDLYKALSNAKKAYETLWEIAQVDLALLAIKESPNDK